MNLLTLMLGYVAKQRVVQTRLANDIGFEDSYLWASRSTAIFYLEENLYMTNKVRVQSAVWYQAVGAMNPLRLITDAGCFGDETNFVSLETVLRERYDTVNVEKVSPDREPQEAYVSPVVGAWL